VRNNPSGIAVKTDPAAHHERQTRKMAMTGYFDESGTHGKESPVVTIAGFIANPDQWRAYERDLSQLLADNEVKVFHARKFRTSKGDFKGWSLPQRARFNSRFLRLSDDHLAYGLATVLQSNDYAKSTTFRAGQGPTHNMGFASEPRSGNRSC
jgi:hypothetical protein